MLNNFQCWFRRYVLLISLYDRFRCCAGGLPRIGGWATRNESALRAPLVCCAHAVALRKRLLFNLGHGRVGMLFLRVLQNLRERPAIAPDR